MTTLPRPDQPHHAVESIEYVHCQITVGAAPRVSRPGINTNIVHDMYYGHTGYGRISLFVAQQTPSLSACTVVLWSM